jgi:hypothetical protein
MEQILHHASHYVVDQLKEATQSVVVMPEDSVREICSKPKQKHQTFLLLDILLH